MAKYKAYPEYKESGVEWLEEIPIHWKMLRHKYVAFFTKGKNPTSFFEKPLKNTLPYLSMECLRNNTIDKYALISNDVRVALEGQPLIIWDGSNAGEFVKGKSGILSSTMAAATLTYPLHSQYYWYLCISIEPEMRKNAVGMGIPHVNGDELKRISFGIPSIYEQKQVAEFLDHETAKIDHLIEKQQQLIELLKEKRQAVISHAVTKGLNPDVPMKDSGVEWLGEVPEHWVSSSLKYMAKVIDCKHITAEFSDVGIPVASISEVKSWFVDLSTAKLTNEKDYLLLIDGGRKPVCGDIIYSRNATVGEAAIVSDNMPDFAMGQDVCLIKTNQKAIPEFILYTLKSDIISQQLNLAMVGSTFKRINVDNIRSFLIAIPPRNEQVLIVKMLVDKLEKYDLIISNAVDLITYMQERRTALISAAVTGKIDVRDWVAPDTQSIEEPQEATA